MQGVRSTRPIPVIRITEHRSCAVLPFSCYTLLMTRDEALSILTGFTKSPNLIKHGLGVEAVMRWYARKFGADEELWGITGLLHDFDYEIHPQMPDHPLKGSAILRERGVPEEIIHAILAHATFSGEPHDTMMKKAVFAADELSGFIIAVALVQRSKKIADVTVEKVMKKLKVSSFAAKVSREEIQQGANELGLPLEEHVGNVLAALQNVHEELDL